MVTTLRRDRVEFRTAVTNAATCNRLAMDSRPGSRRARHFERAAERWIRIAGELRAAATGTTP